MNKEKDYRENQRVISTIQIEDKGQDFTEIDVLENGVILGNSPMFSNGRISMMGIGTLDGKEYYTFENAKNYFYANVKSFEGLFIYLKNTGEKDSLPWEAKTLNYPIIKRIKTQNENRFL